MSKANDLFQKYVWIVNTILRSSYGISFEDLARRWKGSEAGKGERLSRTSFNRYRESIEEMFDINIECRRDGAAYVYYVENPEALHSSSSQSWLLRSLTVGGALQQGSDIKERILLESIPGGQEYLPVIIEALKYNLLLQVEYRKFHSPESQFFELEPYCLKVFRQRWYLVGHNVGYEKNDIRVYALDRFAGVKETDTPFTLPDNFDASVFFENNFGVYVGGEEKAQKIVIRAYGSLVNFLRTLPLHHSQQEIDTQEAWADFSYFLRPTYDFRQELLSQAEQLEVLEPAEFREQFHDSLERACRRHAGEPVDLKKYFK
ncbi:MAG: WYL domain-containing protein [Bacteroidaceae bacterium]|nr:WYL domain-containing protein [Bacteroidaceae bacterium]